MTDFIPKTCDVISCLCLSYDGASDFYTDDGARRGLIQFLLLNKATNLKSYAGSTIYFETNFEVPTRDWQRILHDTYSDGFRFTICHVLKWKNDGFAIRHNYADSKFEADFDTIVRQEQDKIPKKKDK